MCAYVFLAESPDSSDRQQDGARNGSQSVQKQRVQICVLGRIFVYMSDEESVPECL